MYTCYGLRRTLIIHVVFQILTLIEVCRSEMLIDIIDCVRLFFVGDSHLVHEDLFLFLYSPNPLHVYLNRVEVNSTPACC